MNKWFVTKVLSFITILILLHFLIIIFRNYILGNLIFTKSRINIVIISAKETVNNFVI